MNSRKKLAAQVAGAVAIATLIGTSAFAETRHRDATERDRSQQSDRRDNRDGNRQSREQRGNNNQPQTFQRGDSRGSAPQTFDNRGNGQFDRSQADTYRNNRGNDRSQADTYRNNRGNDRSQADAYRNNRGNDRSQADAYRNNRGYDRSQADAYRNNRGNERSQSYGNRNSRPDFDDRGRRSMSYGGRINHFAHERGGYRVWVDGGRYPIWIPEARISLFPRLRVGLSLNFGGYYDPRGYLDAYDYYGDQAYSSGLLRGVVETVDYRRGTLVLRDDISGNFVTTLIRDRRLETLRPGDYAEISGDWTRSGVFEGLRLEDVQGGRY
jgi:hypothetical protein